MIRILLVEDNAVVRNGLANLLNIENDFEVAGLAGNGLEAFNLINSGLKPDIIITDLNMPIVNGFELTGMLVDRYPTIRVIILTMHPQAIFLDKALTVGARGYLLKGEDIDDLFTGIRSVYAGAIYVSSYFHSDYTLA